MFSRIALIVLMSGASLHAQVSFDRIQYADREPHNWLSYSGTPLNQRYSLLKQITADSVHRLQLKWVWQTRSLEKFEATPLVVDGVMYTVQPPNDLVALDANTGRPFWTFSYTPGADARPCCGRVNRGAAILGDILFMGTMDARLIAVDARTGQPVWNIAVAKAAQGFAITHSPLIVKDKVIIGTSGGDNPIRGFIAAYDAKTGAERWRFYTIPGPGEPGHDSWPSDAWSTGGVGVWNAGAYDSETNLVFFGTGNPHPIFDGRQRRGDNLYSNSVVALDADTGTLKWHYQFTPHDVLDYDATQVPVLAEIPWRGQTRKVMLWANRNGVIYVLDRLTGEFLAGKPYVRTNWLDGFDSRGRPNQVKFPSPEGTLFQPSFAGGTNWAPPAFSPRTSLFYVASWENSGSIAIEGEYPKPPGINTRQIGMGQTHLLPFYNDDSEPYGVVRAFDSQTLERRWEFHLSDITWAGVLATAGDVVFSGGRDGYFLALDARTGRLLWKASVGGQVNAGPMSYAIRGKQHVAIAAGNALFVYTLP